jgi:glyoxylase-like metal-dependent hydrolase (beta-lactamase superfamily II)
MRIRQLFDAATSTFTYLVEDGGDAALIDPVREQIERDLGVVRELGLRLRYAIDTHVHADHVTAAGLLRERAGVQTVTGTRGATCADIQLTHGGMVAIGGVELRALETPGHTDDGMSFVAHGHVFTGDTLLVRGCGRTDFQNGDPGALYDSITKVLFALPDDTIVWPGHDYRGHTQTTLGEERRFNPRIANRSREEFIAIMRGLNLPPPAKMAEAVPANRACGRVEES